LLWEPIAVSIHAQPRATKDLDILIQPDGGNAKAVFAALTQYGAPLKGLSPADFAERGPFFHMGREPVAVDILTDIPGVEFEAAGDAGLNTSSMPRVGES
jgi:hypothetical protein